MCIKKLVHIKGYILVDTSQILFNEITSHRSLIVANSKELLKKRQWKERLKESGHLVFEILEAVIKKEEVN